MFKGNFINNLPKIYGTYTGGFIVFIILMAIAEQAGMSAKVIGICFVAFTVLIYALIGYLSRTIQVDAYYLAGRSEINLSKIVSNGLIARTIEERTNDIKNGIYKEINSQIRKIDLESQSSSRIVVLVELNYLERIVKNSGEFVNETSLNPLKVKYILGFSNKSWKLVDFVSGL